MSRLVFSIIFLCFLPINELSSPFKECNSTISSDIKSVDIVDCPEEEKVCILRRNNVTGITATFVPKKGFSSLKAVVHGIILGKALPFYLEKPDACESGISCPFKAGDTGTYVAEIPVKWWYPPIDVIVRWKLVDDKKNDVFCVEIPAKIL